MFKHLSTKNGSLSWEAQRDSESEILEENQQSNNCQKPLVQKGTKRSEHLGSDVADENVQPCETWNLTPIYVAISERRMGKGKGGQRNQPFVYTPHKRRGPISAGDQCRKSESGFPSLIEIQSRECLINDKKKLSRVLKSWARSHLPAELDWRWVRLKM